ncbi:hypothetical protein LXL04_010812 [Taraxacum kok-saghyz]
MEIISAIMGPIVESVLVPVKRHVSYLFSSTKHVRKMDTRIKQLDGTSIDAKKKKETNITGNLEIPTRVPDWLEEVEDVKKRAHGISSIGCGCFNMKRRYRTGRNAFKITKEIVILDEEYSKIIWNDTPRPLGKVNSMTASTSARLDGDSQNDFRSREKSFNDAMMFLQQNHASQVIGLYGMGGVGKTTMMEQLKKATVEKKTFDYVVKVVIGQQTNMFSVQQAIAEYMGQPLNETSKTAREDRLRITFEKLPEGRRKVLVILDDVWESFELKEIGLSPFPNGFKLLLTSRNEKICTQIGVKANLVVKVVRVDVMEKLEANHFFFGITGDEKKGDHELNQLVSEIVKRCGFLPLAIKLIATTLKLEEKFVWRDTLQRLKENNLDKNVQEIIEISYDYLKEEEEKEIFLLCGLFPDDYDIPVEELTRYAWGLRLLHKVSTLREARDRTRTCVQKLKNANLVMDSDCIGCVKMHDLVLSFVLDKVSKGDHPWVINHGDTSKLNTEPGKRESCKSISVTCTGMFEFPRDFWYPNVSLLRLMHGDKSFRFRGDFYQEMKNLHVIAYEKMQYPLLPRSLECSTTIRTLLLQECSLMFDCSAISELSNLEVLSFAHCGINYLPSTIGKLKQLKLLDLTGCVDLRIDDGVLRNLVKVEELYMRVGDGNVIRFTETNCDELAECSEHLSTLEVEFFDCSCIIENTLFLKLERFSICIGRSLEDNKGESIKKYLVENTLKLLTNKDDLLKSRLNELFEKTEVLHLQVDGMNDLQEVLVESARLPQRSFYNLKVLDVFKCENLRYLFTTTIASGLMKLERLTVSECPVLEVLVYSENGGEGLIKFQELKFITLKNLPKLEGFCNNDNAIDLPQLVELTLEDLQNFTSIYPENTSATSSTSNNISVIQPFFNKEVLIPKLEIVNIKSMDKLKEIWPYEVRSSDEVDACMLRKICVKNCEILVNLFPRNLLSLLRHLEELEVFECGNIEVLFNIDMSCVVDIKEYRSNLRRISVGNLGKLRELWRMKGESSSEILACSFQAIESIEIWSCESFINIFTPPLTNSDMRTFMNVSIDGGRHREESGRNIKLLQKRQECSIVLDVLEVIFEVKCVFVFIHLLQVFISILGSSSLCVRGMNQDNWGMSENHGYNHYSNNSCDDEFYNNGCDYGDQYESHDNDWQWTDNSGQNQYQDSSFFPETQESPCFPQNQYHESHDNDWPWTDNPGQNQYQEPPFFSEYQYQNQHQETHDNDWQWTDNPGQNQYQESPSFEQQGSQYHDNDWQWTDNPSQNQYQEPPYVSENQDSLDESFSENLENQDEYSFDENANQMLDMMNISLEKCNQKFDELIELLNLQPSDNIADTTQLEEVSFIFYDEPFDDKEHEPTSPLVEVVMKDYVSLNYTDSESDFENNEVIINLETSNETFYDLETPENRSDTTHENDVSFPFSNNLLDTKLHEPTPPEPELEVVVEDYVPLNDTIPENEEFKINVENNLYEQIIPNVLEGSVEADTDPNPTELKACEKQELRVLLFELTNDPPISDNTLESCLPCFRTKALECQVMEGRFLSKKYNATYAYKSKMKKFYGIKLQRKKFTQRRDVLFFKQRWKFSHKNLKGKRFGLNKVKGNTPFDPGGRPKIKTMGLEAPHYSATDRCNREDKREKVGNPRKTLKSMVALSNEDIAMSKLEVGTISVISEVEISEVCSNISDAKFSFNHLEALEVKGCKDVEVMFEIGSSSSSKDLTITRHNHQPLLLPYLKRLDLENMERMSHVWKCNWSRLVIPQNQSQSSFHNLTNIRLLNCNIIKYLFSPLIGKLLSNLKNVSIRECAAIEEVVSNGHDEMDTPISTHTNTSFFPCLEKLFLDGLPLLKSIDGVTTVTTTSIHDQFKCSKVGVASWFLCQYSKTIYIYSCPSLSRVFPSYVVGQLNKLEELTIWNCESMVELFEIEGVNNVGDDTCTTITIPNSANMIQLPNLTILKIVNCEVLEYVFTSSILASLKHLKELTVGICKALQVIVKEDGSTSNSIAFPRLKSLELRDLPNLKGFFLGMNEFRWPLLEKVEMYGCPEMVIFTSGHSMAPQLTNIRTGLGKHSLECGLNFHFTNAMHQVCCYFTCIIQSNKHVTLRSYAYYPCLFIFVPFPSSLNSRTGPKQSQLRMCSHLDMIKPLQFPWSFSNLVEVDVQWYNYLEIPVIFPCNELHNLKNLEKIYIRGNKIEGVFEVVDGRNDDVNSKTQSGVVLQNLKEVTLVRLYKLRHMWKSSQWMVLHFPNLTKVSIEYCPLLEHIFTDCMVGSLLNLQELQISDCNMLDVIVKQAEDSKTSATEVVFPSLKTIKLHRLPNLKGFHLGKEAFQWPSLDTLEIKHCPKLTVFTCGQSTTPELKRIDTTFGMCHVTEDPNSFIKTKQQEGWKF